MQDHGDDDGFRSIEGFRRRSDGRVVSPMESSVAESSVLPDRMILYTFVSVHVSEVEKNRLKCWVHDCFYRQSSDSLSCLLL